MYTDCFRPSDFDDPVCNIASSEGGSRKRRHAYEDEDGLTYRDFFTGYPSGMKIRKDVADFVSFTSKSKIHKF